MKRILLLLCTLCYFYSANAQPGFTIEIEPYSIKELPPLHAYAFAEHDGKWLIIGGRTGNINEPSYLNFDLMVIDPITEEFWQYPLEYVGAVLEEAEHLGNCYAAHYQDEQYLYIAGGMGYSVHSEAFGPFPLLTIVDIPKTMNAIINKKRMSGCFKQIQDEAFRRQDAFLTKINNRFYLAGGRQVSGAYDDQGDLNIQTDLSNYVFSFLINEEWRIVGGKTMNYDKEFESALASFAPQIFPDGQQGLTVFLNNPEEHEGAVEWMNIFNFGYSTYKDTSTQLAPYHSTVIPVYDSDQKQMHTLFIGGCDDYFCDDKSGYTPEVIDKYEDFVRDENGTISLTNTQMDAFMARGRDAKFILNEDVPHYNNKVIDLQKITTDRKLIGYIYGGATAPGMMMFDDGTMLDTPLNQLFKVYISKTYNGDTLGWKPLSLKKPFYSIQIPFRKEEN